MSEVLGSSGVKARNRRTGCIGRELTVESNS